MIRHIGIGLVLLALLLCVTRARAAELCVASWNVENLFDTEDDPNVEMDEEYTPDSPKQWTPERLEIKLNNLAKIVSKMNDGHGPDVLGLAEVENRKVIEMLVDKLAPLGRKYEIVHKDSPSDRGIDTALIYDSKVLELVDSKFHFVDADKTRDIVEAKLKRVGGGEDAPVLYVFVNHWPSRSNDEWQRIMAATVLRKRLDEILAADPQADIVMVGDFNDEPSNVSLAKFLRSVTKAEDAKDGAVFDTTAKIAEEDQGSLVYDDKWELIDHILVSSGLLDGVGFSWKAGSSQRLDYPELFFHPRWAGAIPRPSTSYSKDNFHKDGYSDHLPLECTISD